MPPILPETRVWTWDEYAALPADGNRYEVLDGRVFVSPQPTAMHQRTVAAFQRHLDAYVEAHALGEVLPSVNLVMGPGRYVGPDLVYIPTERAHGFGGENDLWLEAPPGLIVEVLSPSTRGYDRIKKRRAYEEFGVDEYWIVDPSGGTVEVCRFAAGLEAPSETHRRSLFWRPDPTLPALEIDLESVWGRSRPQQRNPS